MHEAYQEHATVTQEHAITINCPDDPYRLYETTHDWVDIRDGTKIDWLTNDPDTNPDADNAMAKLFLPGGFTFGFYDDENFDTLYVSSNGAVLVSPDGAEPNDVPKENQALSCDTTDNDNCLDYLIAPFWDDLDSDNGYVIYKLIGEAPERQLVLEWHERSHHDSNQDEYITFQMILYENNKNIKFQYDETFFADDDPKQINYGKSATVGIRKDGTELQHKEYAYNQPKLKDNPALCFQYQYLDDPNRYPEPCDDVVLLDKIMFTSVPAGCAERDEYEMTASISPTNALRPITYQWYVEGQDVVTHRKNKDSESDTFSFAWDDPNASTKTVTVTATSGDRDVVTRTQSGEAITITTRVTHTTTVITRSVATLADFEPGLFYSVHEDEITATITVQLSAACHEEVRIPYRTDKRSADTATAHEDYEPVKRDLRFPAGVSTKPISITVVDDGEEEVTEQITIELLRPENNDWSYITYGYPHDASLHILNSESPRAQLVRPENMRADAKQQAEDKCRYGTLITNNKVGEDKGTMCVPVQLNRAVSEPVTVTCRAYDFENPSPGEYPATQGEDYTISASDAVVSFAPGETIGVCKIDITNNNIYEEDEVFTLALPEYEHSTNVSVKENKGDKTVPTMNLTIANDDDPPTLSLKESSMKVNEGDGTVHVVAELSEISTKDVEFTIKVGKPGETATNEEDYKQPKEHNYSIPAGEKTVIIPIDIIDDPLDEGSGICGDSNTSGEPEQFTVSIRENTVKQATLQGIPTTISIEDNDGGPVIQFLKPSYEVNEDGQKAEIQLVRTGDMSGEVIVDYTLSNGTARTGIDYKKPKTQGTVTFPVRTNPEAQDIMTFTVDIVLDYDVEGDETVNLALSNPRIPSGATNKGACAPTLGEQGTSILTILDIPRDDTVQFAQSTYSVMEDEDDTAKNIDITITRTGYTDNNREVTLMVFDATAALDADFEIVQSTGCQYVPDKDPRSINVTFLGGEVERTCTIKTKPDLNLEGNETFNLVLSDPEGKKIGQRNATVTIEDNDVDRFKKGLIEFEIASLDINEDEGDIHTEHEGDTATEDDDFKLRKIALKVRRIGGTEGDVTVRCTTVVGGSASAAKSEATATFADDYVYRGSAKDTITFASGDEDTEKMCEVLIVDNELAEGDETLQVSLAIEAAEEEDTARLGAQKTMTLKILDDDIDPDSDTSIVQFSDAQYRFSEGTNTEQCSAEAIIKLTRVGGIKNNVKVFYEIFDGTARFGKDYTANSDTLEFEPNQSEKTFKISLCGDEIPEGPETVLLRLSYADDSREHVVLGSQSEATLFIEDSTVLDKDTVLVFFSEPVYSVVEGNVNVTIPVERRGSLDKDVLLMHWKTVQDTAIPGDNSISADYRDDSQQLQFPAKQTNDTFEVDIFADEVDEGSERLGLQLFFAEGGPYSCPGPNGENDDKTDNIAYDCENKLTIILGQKDAVLTIQDVPKGPVLAFSEPEYVVREDRGEAFIPILLTGAITNPISVRFRTVDEPQESSVSGAPVVPHPEAGVDYEAVDGIITFKPGDTHYLTAVVVIDRPEFQIDRLVRLELTDVTGGAKLGTQRTATLKIVDKSELEQGVLQFAEHSYYVVEDPDASNHTERVKILRTKGTKGKVCVDYEIMNGSGQVGTDIISGTEEHDQDQAIQPITNNDKQTNTIIGRICLEDGEEEKTITLTAVDDKDHEGKEFVVVVLRNPTNSAIIGPQITTEVNIEDDDIPAGGIVSFAKEKFRVSEADGVAYVTVKREGFFSSTISVDYATYKGDDFPAYAGTDYQGITGTLTFSNTNPATTELTFTVKITDDDVLEGSEFIDLRLSNPTGEAAIGTRGTAYIVIEDNDIPFGQSVVRFGAPTYTANEGSFALLSVLRDVNDVSKKTQATVHYETFDDTAKAGDDYLGIEEEATLTFETGESYATITVTLHADDEHEGYEQFQVRLSNPEPSDTVTLTNEYATVNIIDGTYSEYGVFQFVPGGYKVGEGDGQAEIVVLRNGDNKGIVSVDFMVEDDLARSGANYEPVEGTLTFENKVSTQSFVVPIKDDTLIEGDQNIKMYLRNPQGGATVPEDHKGILTIQDNDFPSQGQGLLQFVESSYVAEEDDRSVTVEVERVYGYTGDVTIDYTIYDASAKLCKDYFQPGVYTSDDCLSPSAPKPATGKLTFKGGNENPDTTQNIIIPIHDDDLYEKEPDEMLYVVLSNAKTNEDVEVPLGDPNLAIVTIGDDEPHKTYAKFVEERMQMSESGAVANIELTEVCEESVTVTYTIQIGDEEKGPYTHTFKPNETIADIPVTNDIKCDKENKRINLNIVGVLSDKCGVELGMQDVTELTYESNEVCPALVYLPLIAGGQEAEPQENPVAPFALTINPNPIVVSTENGKIKLTATVNDKEGKVLPGEVVTFSTQSPNIVAFAVPESTTGAGGVASNELTCLSRGTAEIVVGTRDGQDGTILETVNVTCMDAVPNAIEMEPVNAEARLGVPITLTAKVLEANGNTVTAGKQVTFKVDPPLNPSIQQTVGMTTTNNNGIATLSLPNDELWAGKFTVTASTKNGVEATSEAEFITDTCDENVDLRNTVCRGEIEDAGDGEESESIYKVTIPATNETNPGASELVTLTVFLRGIPEGANYDIELWESCNGDALNTSDNPSNLDEKVSMELSPGTYCVAVKPTKPLESETNAYFLGAIVTEQ